jgi:large subunit ribosomal protein L23
VKQLTAHEIILKPMVTEKAVALQVDQTYAFMVHPEATKVQIRGAIESIYKVHVRKVRTARVQGKTRRFRYREYELPETKKAMVTISENERIEII